MARGIFDSPVVGPLVRRGLVVIRYTGRRSGKTLEAPVGYRRSGNTLTGNVGAPDSKN